MVLALEFLAQNWFNAPLFNNTDIWNLHAEVVAALQYADGSVKRQWLVDAVEISCVSSYPSIVSFFLHNQNA